MSKTGLACQTERPSTHPCAITLGQHLHPGLSVNQHGLSEREVEIMQWLKIGKSNQEIACILEICTCTVKNHLQRIFRKLDVFNRTHAVAKFFITPKELRN